MRSRVMPGSSPTMERRLPVRRLKSVLLPTLGRPTIATRGNCAAAARAGTTDLRYVGKSSLPSESQIIVQLSLLIFTGRSEPDPSHAVSVKHIVATDDRH